MNFVKTTLIFALFAYVKPQNFNILKIPEIIRLQKNAPQNAAEILSSNVEKFKFEIKTGKQKFVDLLSLNDLENVTMECLEDMALLASALYPNSSIVKVPPGFNGVLAQITDAMGAKPPGTLRGAQKFYGFKAECDMIHFDLPQTSRSFETSYSRAYWDSAVFGGGNKTCDQTKTVLIGFDVCLPKSCKQKDLKQVIPILPMFGEYSSAFCNVTTLDDIKVHYDYRSYIVMTIISIVVVIAILASIVDYFILPAKSDVRSEKNVKLFLAFSFYRNVVEIMSAGKSHQPGQIGPLHFIRFISIVWVITCHTFSDYFTVNNFLDFERIVDYPMFQIILNGFFSVDNFFFIGAVLVSFIFFKEVSRNRKAVMSPQGWFMFYFHRYVRLSPSYFMAAAFSAWVYVPWNSGRVWYFSYQKYEDACNKYFWKNVLYFNNIPTEETGCLGQSWYLAADMQMYAMSPVVLIAFVMSPLAGILISMVLFMLSTAGHIITIVINHYPASLPLVSLWDKDAKNLDHYYQLIYYAPWIRCQVYIMGLVLGWCMQKYKKIKIPTFVQMICWCLSLALMLTVWFGLYNYNRGAIHMPLFWRAMYSAFSKPAWGFGLGWIIFACYYGYGGPVNRFLSWNIWVPLGRLSYAAYLLHYTIVMDFVFSSSDYALIFNSVGQTLWNYVIPVVVMTFFFSLIWSSLFEVSIAKVESILLRPSKSKIHLENKINEEIKTNGWDIESLENTQKVNGIAFHEKL